MALVSFYSTTLAQYNALTPKDPDSLYFLDNGQLFKGNSLVGNNIVLVEAEYPETGIQGLLYIKPSIRETKIWNGSTYITITHELVDSINSSNTENQVPTAKAVYQAIKASTPEGFADIIAQVQANKEAIELINSNTDGILAKANAYTDALKPQINSNTTAIEDLNTNKADKATTLQGYGITDAYTKNEIHTYVTEQLANMDSLKREIVDVLPAIQDADVNTIYMRPATDAAGQNLYEEFMLINGAWEKIGDSKVDLTNYATKDDLATAKQEAVNQANTYAESKANAAESNAKAAATTALNEYKTLNDAKVNSNTEAIAKINDSTNGILKQAKDYADSLGKNYATADQGSKADSALQVADITSGTSNGTISVRGNNITITGLKSAAYTESTAYDPAGSATAAYNNAKTYIDGLLTWKSL